MDTLLLDTSTWDLCLDAAGNLALAKLPYAAAQNAATAVKLFQGEYVFDLTKGVPYFQRILGKRPPLALVRAKLIDAALAVPEIVTAQCFFSEFDANRKLSGQLIVTDNHGQTSVAGF